MIRSSASEKFCTTHLSDEAQFDEIYKALNATSVSNTYLSIYFNHINCYPVSSGILHYTSIMIHAWFPFIKEERTTTRVSDSV